MVKLEKCEMRLDPPGKEKVPSPELKVLTSGLRLQNYGYGRDSIFPFYDDVGAFVVEAK
jgi:hypothetical protein